jgi:hypothetical protein
MKSNLQNQKSAAKCGANIQSSSMGRASNQGISWFRKSFGRFAVLIAVEFLNFGKVV